MKLTTFIILMTTAITYGCATDRETDIVEEQREELGIEDEGFYEDEYIYDYDQGIYEDPALIE